MDDGKPDILLILTQESEMQFEILQDEKGEYIVLPDGYMPELVERKHYLKFKKKQTKMQNTSKKEGEQ
jgi:hypothetical protein